MNNNMKDYKPSIDINTSVADDGDYKLVKFTGDLDKAGLEAVKDQLDKLVDSLEEKRIVFDFTDLNFINSEGIGFLMTLHIRLTKKEKDLIIVGAADHVYDVLKVIGLINVIKIFNTMTEFKESIKE